MTLNLTIQLQKSTQIALLLLVVVCGILWGYSFYKEGKNYITNQSRNESNKEKFIGTINSSDDTGNGSIDNSCNNPIDDLLKPFNPNIKGYNDDLQYDNQGNKPWQHHDVQGSLPVDHVVKFNKAYYYEYDNKKYTDRLKTALAVPCSLLADAVNDSSWSIPYSLNQENRENLDSNATQEVTQEVNDAYKACIENVATKLNKSPAMVLPGYIDKTEEDGSASSADIQVVHDIMKSYRKHLKEKSMYLVEMELLLYRENKFEGKHIKLSCTAKFLPNKKVWFTNAVAVDLIGVVPEDQIALFPVNASNPFDIRNLRIDNDLPAYINPLFTIKCKVDKSKKNRVTCTGLPNKTLIDTQTLKKIQA